MYLVDESQRAGRADEKYLLATLTHPFALLLDTYDITQIGETCHVTLWPITD